MKQKVAYFGVFIALAFIFSYIETLIPFQIGIQGVKLGLANLVIVVALYKIPLKEVFILSIVRVILVGLTFGSLMSIFYSLAGGIFSFCVMAFLKRRGGFGIIGVSISGGVAHNIGQIVVAAFLIESTYIFYYLPVLLISGLATGFIIGVLSSGILKRVHSLKL